MVSTTNTYKLCREIGSGGFGQVYFAERVSRPSSPVVIKRSFKDDRYSFDSLIKEAYNLEVISGWVPHTVGYRECGEINGCSALVLDRACSSKNPSDVLNIEQQLCAKGTDAFSWQQMVSCMKQLFECLAALSEWKRLHADLKPSNLTFNFDSNQLYVLDWGASKRLASFQKTRRLGTTETSRAPELILDKKVYDCGTDVWAAGVVLFHIYTGGHRPFSYAGQNTTFKFVLGALGKPSEIYLNSCGVKSREILKYCDGRYKKDWKAIVLAAAEKRKDTKERTDQIIALLERIFCYEGRISASEALSLPLFQSDIQIKLDCDEIPLKERKQLFLSTLGFQIPLSARCVHLPVNENREYEMHIGTAEKCLHTFKATLCNGMSICVSRSEDTFNVKVEEGFLFKLNERIEKLYLSLEEHKG